MLHQPKPDRSSGSVSRNYAIRKMHIRAIEESGLTGADEMLYPRTEAIWMISYLMRQSGHDLWKISSID